MFTARRMAAVVMRQGLLQPRITAASAYAAARPAVGLSMTRRAWETTTTTPAAAAAADVPPIEAESTPVETITEEKATGHFDVKSNEAVLFFSSIFPLKVSSFLVRPSETDHELADLMGRFNSSRLGIMDPIRMVRNAIPEDLPIKVTEILPRLKDGGAFVKFKYPANLDPLEIETDLRTRLTETPVKPWFNPFGKVQARLVRGTPWLEDLYRFPSNFVKVEFVPAEVGGTPEQLSEENIYSLFRRFGKIGDIVAQPADSKELPRYATVNYPLTRHAIMARNCMHGFIVTEELGGGKAGTMLRLSYIKRIRAHNIWNWLTGHPRIVIPILAALLAGFSVMIFDPIRQFFIKLHIHHSLSFSESRIYKWFLTHRDSFRFGTKKDANEDLNNIWNHRKEVITQLEEWVGETSSNFIVVTGPKGTGKVELVMERALKGRKDVLLFDCKPIVEARGEAATIKRLASTVGYRPVFSWANSISSLVDLAVQSTTGVKAGFSETLEAQLTKILYTTASALKDVGLCERNKKDKDATLSDDAYLEAHPERRPIVVIDNFLHKSDDNSVVYDKVSEWAASLVQNNAAQVIFVTSDGTFSKPLSKALPDRVFRVVSLGDLEPDVARSFVQGRLDAARPPEDAPVDADGKPRPSINIHGLDTAIETLGGRLMDLESLARRIQAGQSPRQATDEIVSECAIDTVKMFLMGKTSEDVQKHWSTEQVWHLVKGLAKEPSLRYNQVLLSSTFSSSLNPSGSSGTAALESLAAADLISIKSSRGHPKLISAAKPVQQAAFGLLTGDRVLNAKMDLALMTELSKIEAKTIDKAETELALLGSLPRQTFETAGRIQYLLTKLDASQQKILLLESNMAGLKKVLSEED